MGVPIHVTNCPYCGKPMEEGFITITTDGLADMSWGKKPSVLGLGCERITGWALLARNLEGLRCRECKAILFRY